MKLFTTNTIKILTFSLITIGLILLGRFTVNKSVDNNNTNKYQEEINKLIQDTVRLSKIRDLAIDSMNIYKSIGNDYYNKFINTQASKILYQRKYENQVSNINKYTTSQLDSAILAGFAGFH